MNVIQFPGHKVHRCLETCAACRERCKDCIHDVLYQCATCGGAEGSLPTHCPGEKIHWVVLDDIHRGTVDYNRRRGWIRKIPAKEKVR